MLRMAFRHHSVVNPPPKSPPSELLDQFTMDGAIPVGKWYINDVGNQHFKHSKEYVEEIMTKVGKDSYCAICVNLSLSVVWRNSGFN